MKILKNLTAGLLTVAVLCGPLAALAGDQKADAKAKPYPLKTCLVSDEKLGGMGEPFAFVHEGQEIKLCCKDCQKEFKKNPAKFAKKLKDEEAKAKKAKAS
jgi:hypothetical protein